MSRDWWDPWQETAPLMPLYKTVRLLPQIKPQTKKQNKTKQKQNPEEKPKAKISQTTLLSSHTGPALPHSTVSPLVFLLLFLKHTLLPGALHFLYSWSGMLPTHEPHLAHPKPYISLSHFLQIFAQMSPSCEAFLDHIISLPPLVSLSAIFFSNTIIWYTSLYIYVFLSVSPHYQL